MTQETTQIPVTVVHGLPAGTDADDPEAALLTAAVAEALGVVVADTATRYTDPRDSVRRHPRGAWGLPGADTRWQTVFSPAGFRG
ncbi:acetyl-CoA carboxylase subunit [uncultured Corynebacterium sp.]|uniref:acetyl-CoA carboxylase subunit n=1 Tax=uncultured Corynebacterium sp. TaxID=159447 RepID=UPI0025F2B9C7|nr:acetyl-CoA carboxylase subunit [uncultured Corynebacterium sp.]